MTAYYCAASGAGVASILTCSHIAPTRDAAGRNLSRCQMVGGSADRILVSHPNSLPLRNLVSRKLLQRRRDVLDRGRTILRTDGPVGVAGDVVRHSLAYADTVGDLLEGVTPSIMPGPAA